MPSEWAKQKAHETLDRIERSPDAGDYHHDAEAWAEALDEARAAGRREAKALLAALVIKSGGRVRLTYADVMAADRAELSNHDAPDESYIVLEARMRERDHAE